MSYDVLPLDPQLADRLDDSQRTNSQAVFVVDSWAAQTNFYDAIFAEVDKEKHRACPVLVPLNNKDEENRTNRPKLLEALAGKMPGRASAGGIAFFPDISDEVEYQKQLGRALVSRQSEFIGGIPSPPSPSGAPFPAI